MMIEKITYVYKFYLPNHGGIEKLMNVTAKEVMNRGIKPYVLTLSHSGLKRYEIIEGIEVHRTKYRWLLFSQIDLGINKSTVKEVLRKVDAVHVFSSIPSHLLLTSLKLCKKLGKVCIWQPIFIPNRFKYHKSGIIRLLGSFWDRYFLQYFTKFTHGIVALTSAEAEFFRRGCHSCNFVVDVLGECVEEVLVNESLTNEALRKYGLSKDGFVLSVGRLVWYKGYDLLVRAWRFVEPRYPGLKLVIVGSDWGYKRVILDMVRRYGLRNVVLLEGVPDRELHALYEGSMFVVQLSRFETFHRIALEAWSHRKPIVALDLGPATEHIASDRGILVRDDVREVVRAIETLIEDGGLRRRMGLRGYEVFRSRYRADRYVDRLLDLYRRAEEVARS